MYKSIIKTSVVLGAIIGLNTAAVAGELTIVGTGDGLDMLRAVAVDYVGQHPEHKLSVPPSIGSGGAIAAVAADTERMGRVARPLKPSEAASGMVYLPIAKIPSAIIAHPSSKVTGLTSAQLVDIYSGKAKSWAEFGGADIKIKVVRREDSDSTLQVLRGSMPGWADLEITLKSKTAVTTQDAIETVRQVDGAIGFSPYSRALDLDTTVMKIDGKFPTDADYPSAVEFALIYKEGRIDAEMKSFLEFACSEAAAKVIENYGGVPTAEKSMKTPKASLSSDQVQPSDDQAAQATQGAAPVESKVADSTGAMTAASE